MSAPLLAALTAQVAAVGVIGWVVADRVLERIGRGEEDLAWPERALLAVVGFIGFAVALMVGHMVTGGAVFGVAGIVPVCAMALVGYSWRRVRAPHGVPWLRVAAAGAILAVLYLAPVVLEGPGTRTGDPPLHMGWTEELLAGEPVPTGPAPQYGRNAYPWGFHAVLATMVRMVPGSDPLAAHEALHVVLMLAIPLGAACLARRIDRRAGWLGAAAAGLIGGFGWIKASTPDLVISPRNARYGADLVVASPNSVYELFPPALPRELGLVGLAAVGVLLTLATGAGGRRAAASAGAALGVVGLVSVPMLMAGAVWTVAALTVMPRGRRRQTAVPIFSGAAAIFALWLAPTLSSYLRFGGFVDVTPRLGVEWPLGVALASWGLLLPSAAAGVVLLWRHRRGDARVLCAFLAGTAIFFGLTIARSSLSWKLANNETLLHQGRVWPVAHLVAAALAGVALWRGFLWIKRRKPIVATVGVGAVLAVGAISPALASLRLTEYLAHDQPRTGFVYGAGGTAPGSFVRRAASHLGPDDVVRVDSAGLGLLLFSFSGVKLAEYDHPRLEGNDLRIRYRELAQAWDGRIAAGGFDADFLVRRLEPGPPPPNALQTGYFRGDRWGLFPAD